MPSTNLIPDAAVPYRIIIAAAVISAVMAPVVVAVIAAVTAVVTTSDIGLFGNVLKLGDYGEYLRVSGGKFFRLVQ